MSAHRTRPRSPRAALSALILVATCVAGLLAATGPSAAAAAAAAAAASPRTEAEFVADLFASCPDSGEPVPAYTGRANSCTWVPLDSSGRPIDTANGNQNGIADPRNVTTYWGAGEPYAQGFTNCTGTTALNSLNQAETTTYSHSYQLTVSETTNFLDLFSVGVQHTFGFSWDDSHTESLTSTAYVPPLSHIDWMVSKHLRQVRGAMRVELSNRVSDPANPSGGAHWIWYPGLTWTGPAGDDSGRFVTVAPQITPLDPSSIVSCANASVGQAQPLVNKFATENGTAASGFCATVTPEVLALPCSSSPGPQQDQQQFVLVPIPLTTGDNRYLIVSPTQQACLGSGSGVVHSAVVAQPCDARARGQLWYRVATTGNANVYQYASASSNLCMNAWASATSSRAKYGINQERCGDASFSVDTQLWASTTTPFPARTNATPSTSPTPTPTPTATPTATCRLGFTSLPRRDATGAQPQLSGQDDMIVAFPGSSFAYRPLAAGAPAPTITAQGLAPWMTFDAGVLSGIAPIGLDAAVTFPLTLTARSGNCSATQDVVVSVVYVAG